MSKEWTKAETNTGIPYYINHTTERTQWDHPDLVRYLQSLENMSTICFAAYRTAMKLRKLQKLLHLDVVDLSTINSAFEQHGFHYHNDTVMDALQLHNIIYELYFLTKSKGRSSLDVNSCSDLLHNWILNLYDTSRTGCLRVLSVKIGIAVLCASRITEKYKYLFQQVADRAGGVSHKNMTAMLQDIMQFTELIGESSAFGTNVDASVNSCFQTVLGSTVTKERFMEWLMSEPQTIVWLPTMHRLATAETMKHEVKCNICKMHPIVGFRYKCLKCLNFDLCQDCFFTGCSSKNHKYTHPTQEYCMGASSKEDVRAFAKTVRNKLSKKHGGRIKQKYLAVDNGGGDVDNKPRNPRRRSSNMKGNLTGGSDHPDEAETHLKMGQLSKRLAALESIEPLDGPFVDIPPVATADGRSRPGGDASDDEDRYELEDLIDQLEQENENLLHEMENLRLERSRLPRHIRDSRSESSDDESISGGGRPQNRTARAGDASLRQHNDIMKARQEVLEENNRELEHQLQQLKEIMRKKYLSRQVQHTLAVPPPRYHGSLRPNLHHMSRGDMSSIGGHGSSLVTPPTIAYHYEPRQQAPPLLEGISGINQTITGIGSYGANEFLSVQSPLVGSNFEHPSSILPDQSRRSIDLIDRQRAPPPMGSIHQSNRGIDTIDSSLFHPTPTAAGVDQSLATSALIDRHRMLPPHISDQSELRFPNLGVSRAYPKEEEELDDLLQKLDEAYPVNFTYNDSSSPREPLLSNQNEIPSMQLPPSPQGRRGGHPQDMISAAARVGHAMSSLVARVATADAV